MDLSTYSRPVQCAQDWVSRLVGPGDTVIDATAGNGHDTLFLARLVGERGRVYAFDVQAKAIESTRVLLSKNGFDGKNIMLHRASHILIEEYVPIGVKAVMFNLGYLPGEDKSIISRKNDTIPAVCSALKLTKKGGIVSVVCYPGHEGGGEESFAVAELFCNLDSGKWRVAKLSHWNEPSPSPFLLAAFRLK